MTAPTRIGRYEIVRRLGKSMTDVFLAIDTIANRKAALKLIEAKGDESSRMVVEAERRGASIQRDLRVLDPRVVEIYDFGDLEGYFFVAMEYVEGRNLADVLLSEHVIDPIRAATIALEICEQLAKFHAWQSAVVHGDIKPSNIHLGLNDTVRLLDFGIAKRLRADRNSTLHNFGSPGYCAPERLSRSQVDQQSDLWAVGATLYEMLAGVPPYQAESTRKLESLIRSKRAPRALPPTCPRALRAVVTKALAPNPGQRYGSAQEFQGDLQTYLEHKPTAAEIEQRRGWSPNSTIEAARACLRRVTRTAQRVHMAWRVGGGVACFVMGMGLWIGGAYGWQAWHTRQVAAASIPPAPVVTASISPAPAAPPPADKAAPATLPAEQLPVLYAVAGERILESYRKSSDPSLHDFDWQKAEVCLGRAVELGGSDDRVLGELALSRGYAALERLAGSRYSAAAATQLRLYARDQFATAALKMPQSPDPHLALARVYVYSLPDVTKATAEFVTAEQLGAVLGQREFNQREAVSRYARHVRKPASRRRRWR